MPINQNNLKEKASGQGREIESKLRNYVGPEGISTKQLEVGLWYITNKLFLKQILNILLIFIGALSWAYTLYGFTYYLIIGRKADQALVREMTQTNIIGHDYVAQIGAKPLTVSPIGIIKSGQKSDFYVQLRNSNEKWWVEFDYYFAAAGAKTEKVSGYIFPLETKYFFSLAQEFGAAPSGAQLFMENVRWRRIDQHEISDWRSYYQGHVNFTTSEIVFTPADASTLSDKLKINQLSFKVTNNTAYNYWHVVFGVVLHGSGGIVNVTYYTIDNFLSGQTRQAAMSWPGNISQIDRVEIIPEINLMKDDIYIKY